LVQEIPTAFPESLQMFLVALPFLQDLAHNELGVTFDVKDSTPALIGEPPKGKSQGAILCIVVSGFGSAIGNNFAIFGEDIVILIEHDPSRTGDTPRILGFAAAVDVQGDDLVVRDFAVRVILHGIPPTLILQPKICVVKS
jgi:hypothetical protein